MAGPNGYAGTVESGTGGSYRVRLNTGVVVDVTQMQIDPGETVDPGTKVLVVKVGVDDYRMQVPVWQAG
jgi:hypothetical protein